MSGNATLDRPALEGMRQPPHFSNVVVSEDGKLAHISGQMATDGGRLAGEGDLAAQFAQTFANLRKVLDGLGATPDDVVRQRIFVVDLEPAHRDIVVAAMNDFYGEGKPASTLIGCQGLIIPGALVEIDLTAAIDG